MSTFMGKNTFIWKSRAPFTIYCMNKSPSKSLVIVVALDSLHYALRYKDYSSID